MPDYARIPLNLGQYKICYIVRRHRTVHLRVSLGSTHGRIHVPSPASIELISV